MSRIPPSALLLTLAVLVPFVWSALFIVDSTSQPFPLSFGTDGDQLMIRYGIIVLCFMSGDLWGLATRAEGPRATAAYLLSVLPAFWVFLSPDLNPGQELLNILLGFIGVIALDYIFWKWELTPSWWMSLRTPLCVSVIACFAVSIWV